ncbi:phosphohexomutase domain-containing protein [Desulfotalea psychrophila]|nr:phosphomannomutase/phosphoglucomutase [Desulfotalea psychrophila]
MTTELTCFTAYDVRGRLGSQLDTGIAYRIGRAYGEYLKPRRVVVGGDIRQTSESLKLALAEGLMDAGVDVLDIGLVGTEEIYFATKYLEFDGGIEVTASHNPIDYNGLKFVREESRPISGDTGLFAIKELAERQPWQDPSHEQVTKGVYSQGSTLAAYVDHLLGYIDLSLLQPTKLVVNSGNGVAGHVVDALEKIFEERGVPVQFVKVHHQADGSFPNGIPNPLLPECRQATSSMVKSTGATMGIAWDGDFDRCFLFDENGSFVDGYYVVGLLAEAFLQKSAGEKIIYDPRLTWNTEEVVASCGGQAILCKTGHAFIKERMRREDAVYGGEMSAHHYFRDFAYCDSGMIPWLLVLELLSVKRVKLSEMVAARIAAFPSSGEINSKLAQPKESIERVLERYKGQAVASDYTDGISLSFAEPMGQWRFSLRSSNTEPVVRLNVESRGDRALMELKTAEVLAVLREERG